MAKSNNHNQPIDPEGKHASNGAGKKSGKYNVLVKVIDIFGNDTTKLVEVKI